MGAAGESDEIHELMMSMDTIQMLMLRTSRR